MCLVCDVQVEQLEEVERAFVHVDYTRRDGLEHKVGCYHCCCLYSMAYVVLPSRSLSLLHGRVELNTVVAGNQGKACGV
jgi:hypothetical protein